MASPPASKADGRRKPVWEFDSPALRPVPGGRLGEIPKLDKGPPWNGGRRAVPVRGFESHSLRCARRTLPALEAIRMVEEPGLNPGGPLGASGVRTAPLPRPTLST